MARSSENERAIRAAITRWETLNAPGRSLGRGLSAADIVERVCFETGASKTYVRYARSRPERPAPGTP